MIQLRIYTLRSPNALRRYATVHWARHLTTFTTFGVTIHGVWTEHSDSAHRLVALVRYPPGADPEHLTRQIMASP
ncbi:MAG: NIPSNAP domain-containing protein [Mycobacterium sp.]